MEYFVFFLMYFLVGIGTAIGASREDDSLGVAMLRFFVAFVSWPILLGFRITDKD